jgi:hypothetical protein
LGFLQNLSGFFIQKTFSRICTVSNPLPNSSNVKTTSVFHHLHPLALTTSEKTFDSFMKAFVVLLFLNEIAIAKSSSTPKAFRATSENLCWIIAQSSVTLKKSIRVVGIMNSSTLQINSNSYRIAMKAQDEDRELGGELLKPLNH